MRGDYARLISSTRTGTRLESHGPTADVQMRLSRCEAAPLLHHLSKNCRRRCAAIRGYAPGQHDATHARMITDRPVPVNLIDSSLRQFLASLAFEILAHFSPRVGMTHNTIKIRTSRCNSFLPRHIITGFTIHAKTFAIFIRRRDDDDRARRRSSRIMLMQT